MIWAHFAALAQQRSDAPALSAGGRQSTYGALAQEASALAGVLAMRGVRRGGRVGWLDRNAGTQLTHLLACARQGAIQVPLNWRLAPEELRFQLEHCGATLLMTGPDSDDMARLARAVAPAGCRWIDDTELLPEASGRVEPTGRGEDPVLLVYTSGTTGRPKGAVVTQAAIMAHAAMTQTIFGLTHSDRVLTVLPMFHLGGLNIQTLPALLTGAEVVLRASFDPDDFFDACAQHRPTLSLLVPAVMRALIEHPRWSTADLSSLRAVGAGSSEVPLPLIEAFFARGITVQQVYGATETGPIAIAQTIEDARAAPGSIGRPAPGTEARLVDGEMFLRGPQIMRGYWGDAEATAAVLRDGWYATGDLGRMDAAGYWWFEGRRTHRIISGGENIAPAEVERVLRDAPGVADVAVCGRPDPRWGEVPVAIVVPRPGFDAAAVLAHCVGRLARFKQPRAVVAVAALPRTALGKIDLAALRALALSG